MAGRTSASIAVGATITILSLLTLALFVLFTVFFGKYKDQAQQLATLRSEQQDVIKTDERNRDDVRQLISQARTDGNKSLVGYLVDNRAQVMRSVTGVAGDTPADLAARLRPFGGDGNSIPTGSVLGLANQMNERIKLLEANLAQAERARDQAVKDRESEVARISTILASHQQTIDRLSAEVNQNTGLVDDYRRGSDTYKAEVAAQLERARTAAAETERQLKTALDKANEENLILQQQVSALRGQRNTDLFRGSPEESLVDATIVGADGDGRVYLPIGAKQRVVLGMTFTVYNNASAIRPDENGNYPRGKGTIEVINVGETTSVARVTSEVRGNPIIKGDVVANAVYDPNKTYKFMLSGNFDTNRDGIATPAERMEIVSMIQGWGGSIAEELTGDVDFVVLGERPVVPPQPGSGAPIEVVQQFVNAQRDASRYDDLFRQAGATSVPVLSENRLYTLIGHVPARR